MISFAIIIFREVLEIALVLGILLAATSGLKGRIKWIYGGIVLGIVGSLIVAVFAQVISDSMAGMGQEVFNAIVLFLAAILIISTVVWMRTHARELSQQLKKVGHDVKIGKKPLYTLLLVITLTVLRDGAEIVMFTHGVLASGEQIPQIIFGSLMGMIVGTAVGVAIYFGLIKMATRWVFDVTSWMLIFLAAGMVSQAVGFLAAAGFVPEIISPLWDTSCIISENSFLGKILHTLVGYCARPSAIQMISYVLTLGVITMVMRFYNDFYLITNNTKKAMAGVLFIFSLILLFPAISHATKKVYSPIVEKGEVEIEARGSYDFDDEASKDGLQKQKYALGYGVTDRWFTELYGEIEKARNDNGEDLNFKFTTMEWENRYQLTEQGRYWLDAGLYLAYEIPFENKHPGELEAKILLEKSLLHFTHTANIIFKKEVGGGATNETEGGFAWSSKYRLSPYFEPGFEYHADFGVINEHRPYDQQQHQFGPAFYGRLLKHVRYDIGYLFGTSKASPDGELKWILEFEQHF